VLLQGRTPPSLAGLRLSVTMPPLHEGQRLAQPSSRQQQEAGHGSSGPAAQQMSGDGGSAVGLPRQLPEHLNATAASLQRQDGHMQQHGGWKEQERLAEGQAPRGASPTPALTSAAAVQPSRSRLSNGGGGRSSRHAHFADAADPSLNHGDADVASGASGIRAHSSSRADSSPVSNGSLVSDLPPQSPPGSPPAPEVVAAAAAAAGSTPPGVQASQQRAAHPPLPGLSHPPLPGLSQHRRPGQRRAVSLAARSGSGASPRLGLEALLGVERSGYSGAGHIYRA
jgi:hypothetical protein